jgi:hypothetical protein
MAKRNVTRGAPGPAQEPQTIALRVTSPFIHRGVRVLVGEVIQCTQHEAEGALFVGWATPHLVNGAEGRHHRRDMRAEE